MTSRPAPSAFARHWDLDPDVVFLNHGSFGACPRVVLEHQRELRAELEAEPVRFLARDLEGRLDAARRDLAAFVGCDADDLAFVANATAGVNTVLRSLAFSPGDELLVTDHEYNACRNALDFVANRSGARVVVAPITLPIGSPEQIVDAVLRHVTPRTKLLLVDHVTSATGLVMPIEPIVRTLRERGIDTLVDGAHAPGMVPVAIDRLGAAYYTGNCHKWLCAPKGAAFLHVRRERQNAIRPLSISHGANATRTDRSRFRLEFDFTGTADPTPFLCVAPAIRFLAALLPGGIDALQRHNRTMALGARDLLAKAVGTTPIGPESTIGSLASVALPADAIDDAAAPHLEVDPLQTRLWERHRIEVPVMRLGSQRFVRVSPQIYNSMAQYEYLARALAADPTARSASASRG